MERVGDVARLKEGQTKEFLNRRRRQSFVLFDGEWR
jgi:hypothetical protein